MTYRAAEFSGSFIWSHHTFASPFLISRRFPGTSRGSRNHAASQLSLNRFLRSVSLTVRGSLVLGTISRARIVNRPRNSHLGTDRDRTRDMASVLPF